MLWLFRLLLAVCPLDPAPVALARASIHEGAARADPDREADEPLSRVIEIAAFSLDRVEVTRGAYAACALTGRCRASGTTWRDLASRLPMTEVSWLDAAAYCAAAGARLPSEVEWERAARGVNDVWRFPWGDTPDCTRANWGNYEGEGRCPANPGEPVAAGSHGAGPHGLHDMIGNVWEWTADYYGASSKRPTVRGAEELGRAPRRSVRGGACCSILATPRITNRVGWPEDYRDGDLGFRCAR